MQESVNIMTIINVIHHIISLKEKINIILIDQKRRVW